MKKKFLYYLFIFLTSLKMSIVYADDCARLVESYHNTYDNKTLTSEEQKYIAYLQEIFTNKDKMREFDENYTASRPDVDYVAAILDSSTKRKLLMELMSNTNYAELTSDRKRGVDYFYKALSGVASKMLGMINDYNYKNKSGVGVSEGSRDAIKALEWYFEDVGKVLNPSKKRLGVGDVLHVAKEIQRYFAENKIFEQGGVVSLFGSVPNMRSNEKSDFDLLSYEVSLSESQKMELSHRISTLLGERAPSGGIGQTAASRSQFGLEGVNQPLGILISKNQISLTIFRQAGDNDGFIPINIPLYILHLPE